MPIEPLTLSPLPELSWVRTATVIIKLGFLCPGFLCLEFLCNFGIFTFGIVSFGKSLWHHFKYKKQAYKSYHPHENMLQPKSTSDRFL
jgi:hypothetical protein